MFYLLIYRPLINFLSLLTFILNGNLGLAIFLLAILVRLCISPLNRNLMKQQQKLTTIQPQLQKIQEQYKNEPQKFLEETQKLYRAEGIKMSSLFNGMFLQIILLMLFFIFIRQIILKPDWTQYLYNFITIPFNMQNVNFNFLGILNLKEPNFYLLLIYIILTLIPTVIQFKTSKQNTSSTLIFIIIIFGLFLWKWQDFSAAVVLSWIGMALVSLGEIVFTKLITEKK